jgi:hypothetical protein
MFRIKTLLLCSVLQGTESDEWIALVLFLETEEGRSLLQLGCCVLHLNKSTEEVVSVMEI